MEQLFKKRRDESPLNMNLSGLEQPYAINGSQNKQKSCCGMDTPVSTALDLEITKSSTNKRNLL